MGKDKKPPVTWEVDIFPNYHGGYATNAPTLGDFRAAIRQAEELGFTDDAKVIGTKVREVIKI